MATSISAGATGLALRSAVLSLCVVAYFAALRPITSLDAQGDGFGLVIFDAGSPALCLDGSRAGYYFRPGVGSGASTWLLELEGGGWCPTETNCLSRASTDIGSSKNWPATGCPGMDGGSNGMFSSDCTINPRFCEATAVHFNYCDGASFAGHRDAPINVSGTPIYFRGRDILDETISYLLLREGMNTARSVVLKGCSAGGLATILHLDYVADVLTAAIPGVSVVGIPDAGVFLDHNDTQGRPTWTPQYQYVASMQNTTPSVDAGCVAAYGPADQWKCFMAQYTIPFVTTPAFFAQDLDDSWQMQNIFDLPCAPSANQPGNCNATELGWMLDYRQDTLSALQPVLASSVHGGFFTDCVQHCHTNINYCWNGALIQNQTMMDTFWSWYQFTVNGTAKSIPTSVVANQYGQNPTCTAACSPY